MTNVPSNTFSFTVIVCMFNRSNSVVTPDAMFLNFDISEGNDFSVRVVKTFLLPGSPPSHCASFTPTNSVSGDFMDMLGASATLTEEQNGFDLKAPVSAFTVKQRFFLRSTLGCDDCARNWGGEIAVTVVDCKDYGIITNAADQPGPVTINMDSWQAPQLVNWAPFSIENAACGINASEFSCSWDGPTDYCEDSNFMTVNGRTLTFNTRHFLENLVPTPTLTFTFSEYKVSAKPANPPTYTFTITLVNHCLDATLEASSE